MGEYFNQLLATTVGAHVEQRLASDPAAELKILEVGAGTGATSARVLEALKQRGLRIKEYCYTLQQLPIGQRAQVLGRRDGKRFRRLEVPVSFASEWVGDERHLAVRPLRQELVPVDRTARQPQLHTQGHLVGGDQPDFSGVGGTRQARAGLSRRQPASRVADLQQRVLDAGFEGFGR
jgi:hypothetical protein